MENKKILNLSHSGGATTEESFSSAASGNEDKKEETTGTDENEKNAKTKRDFLATPTAANASSLVSQKFKIFFKAEDEAKLGALSGTHAEQMRKLHMQQRRSDIPMAHGRNMSIDIDALQSQGRNKDAMMVRIYYTK